MSEGQGVPPGPGPGSSPKRVEQEYEQVGSTQEIEVPDELMDEVRAEADSRRKAPTMPKRPVAPRRPGEAFEDLEQYDVESLPLGDEDGGARLPSALTQTADYSRSVDPLGEGELEVSDDIEELDFAIDDVDEHTPPVAPPSPFEAATEAELPVDVEEHTPPVGPPPVQAAPAEAAEQAYFEGEPSFESEPAHEPELELEPGGEPLPEPQFEAPEYVEDAGTAPEIPGVAPADFADFEAEPEPAPEAGPELDAGPAPEFVEAPEAEPVFDPGPQPTPEADFEAFHEASADEARFGEDTEDELGFAPDMGTGPLTSPGLISLGPDEEGELEGSPALEGLAAETVAEMVAQAEPEPEAGAEPEAEPEPEAGAEPEAEPEPEPEPEGEPEPAAMRLRELLGDLWDASRPSRLDYEPAAVELPEWCVERSRYDRKVAGFARVGLWRKLADAIETAARGAEWAQPREVRASLLLDLAHLKRDRLKDQAGALEAYEQVLRSAPDHEEAVQVLAEHYRAAHQDLELYTLYLKAAEARWDPSSRVELARKAAQVASDMGRQDLAVGAWEHVWQLGERDSEVETALTREYRRSRGWDQLARFLQDRVDSADDAMARVLAWELGELNLAARGDHEGMVAVADRLLADNATDAIALALRIDGCAGRGSWDGFAERIEAVGGLPTKLQGELLADAALALGESGEYELALQMCQRLRGLGLDVEVGRVAAVEQDALVHASAPDVLIAELERRAEAAEELGARVDLLRQAAKIAEDQLGDPDKAVELYDRVVEADPAALDAYQALERHHESGDNAEGLAAALEGQLKCGLDKDARVALLRRLGQHYAAVLKDDDRAATCWRQLLNVDPTDAPTRREFAALYQRRGDFEKLDSAYHRQIWMTEDPELNLELRIAAAKNIDEHIDDAVRAVEAWERVLDVAPTDVAALDGAAAHTGALEHWREQLGLMDQALAGIEDEEAAEDRALDIAATWEANEHPVAALVSYETLLRHRPTNPTAVEAALRLWTSAGHHLTAVALLEHSAARADEPERKSHLLKLALETLPKDRHRERLALLRRRADVEGPDEELLNALVATAGEAKAKAALFSTLEELVRSAEGEDAARVNRRLIDLLMAEEGDPARGYVRSQSPFINARDAMAQLDELEKVAVKAGRAEDLLAVIEAALDSDEDGSDEEAAKARLALLERRARLCEQVLNDPARALEEHRRRLAHDPTDFGPLGEMERLAKEHGLWGDLDDAYGWLLMRLEDNAQRHDVHHRRHQVRGEGLGDRSAAFDALLVMLREPSQPDKADDELIKAAKGLDAWDRLLPLLESKELEAPAEASPEALEKVARLHEKHGQPQRALVLFAHALRLSPTNEGLAKSVEKMAKKTKWWDVAAQALRMAAARERQREEANQDAVLRLLERTAEIYSKELESPQRAVEMHRAVLELRPDRLQSLEVMLDVHRSRSEWRDLRDRLTQWIEHAPKDRSKVDAWLEVATLSVEKLDDPARALGAYVAVLEEAPKNKEAKERLAKLREDADSKRFEVELLQNQWRFASKENAQRIALEAAKMLERDLGEPAEAIETLEAVLEIHGANDDVTDELCRLLSAEERWDDLADVVERRAEGREGAEAVALLDEAVAIHEEQLGGEMEPSLERLYGKLLEADHSPERLARLARLLGRQERWEDLAKLIGEAVDKAEDEAEKTRLLKQLARVRQAGLGDADGAEEVLGQLQQRDPEGQGSLSLAALADLALAKGDVDRYIQLREEHAKGLPDAEAALVLCHLAEVCDEHDKLNKKVVPYYRRARKLDAKCAPASEALKAFGRRLKNLRGVAALLPEEGEAELSNAERAARLAARGDALVAGRPAEAADWYRRAVAVHPHAQKAWEGLGEAMLLEGDEDSALAAWRNALWAYQWTHVPNREGLKEEARLLQATAEVAETLEPEIAETLLVEAHRLDPEQAGPALAVAHMLHGRGDTDEASELLLRVLRRRRATGQSGEGDVQLLCTQAQLLRDLGRAEEALAVYQQALDNDPLNPLALSEASAALRGEGRAIAATRHALRSLLVLEGADARGHAFASLAHLLEDDLQRREEALACVETALDLGVVDEDVVALALDVYRAAGQLEPALKMASVLIESTDDPDRLAQLWTTRGLVLAELDPSDPSTVEAFEMALSYDPDRREALSGLADVFEARGDWDQLSVLLEPMAQSDDPKERLIVLRKLVSIARSKGDVDEEEERLREVVEIDPRPADLERLLEIYGGDPDREADRLTVMADLLAYGGPWAQRVWELTEILSGMGARRSAYGLSSILRRVSRPAPEVRRALEELRKEFERSADLQDVSEDTLDALAPSPVISTLTEVLVELEDALPELAAGSELEGKVIKMGPTTGHGKIAARVTEALRLPERTVYRAESLEEPFRVVGGEEPGIAIRAELLNKLVQAPAAMVLTWGLYRSAPGAQLLAGRDAADRKTLMDAIWLAAGLTEPEGASEVVKELAGRIVESLDESALELWRDMLEPLGAPESALERWWRAQDDSGFALGVAVTGDLRQVLRAVSIMDGDIPQLKASPTFEDLDGQIGEIEGLPRMISLAARAAVLQGMAEG